MMCRILSTFILFALFHKVVAPWSSVVYTNDITFNFEDKQKTYWQVGDRCDSGGGHGSVVYVESSAENQFLADNLWDQNPVLLGIYKLNGEWIWDATGREAVFTAWKAGEPAPYKSCAFIEPSSEWTSIDCGIAKYVCCREGPIPEETVATTAPPPTTREICPVKLGVEDGSIPDDHLSASSEFGTGEAAEHGRLGSTSGVGSWSPLTLDQNQWIQVDLDILKKVTGIITQGRHNTACWVETFDILYSVDGTDFNTIVNGNCDIVVFDGNTDSNTEVTNMFPYAVYAQFIRIHPVTYDGYICLRFELLGCGDLSELENATYPLCALPTTEPPTTAPDVLEVAPEDITLLIRLQFVGFYYAQDEPSVPIPDVYLSYIADPDNWVHMLDTDWSDTMFAGATTNNLQIQQDTIRFRLVPQTPELLRGPWGGRIEPTDPELRITELRGLYPLNTGAYVRPVEPFIVTSVGGHVQLVTDANENQNLRWSHNGVNVPYANGLEVFTITEARVEDDGVYECYLEGRRDENKHAFFIVNVRECPTGYCGLPNCRYECPICHYGGQCEPESCTCICPAGYKGEFCEIVHVTNHFSQDGLLRCSASADSCASFIFCVPKPLGCHCVGGFSGLDCTTRCPAGKYGPGCMLECSCPADECDYHAGCSSGCTNGMTGPTCTEFLTETQCPTGFYGTQCEFQCDCERSYTCEKISGDCDQPDDILDMVLVVDPPNTDMSNNPRVTLRLYTLDDSQTEEMRISHISDDSAFLEYNTTGDGDGTFSADSVINYHSDSESMVIEVEIGAASTAEQRIGPFIATAIYNGFTTTTTAWFRPNNSEIYAINDVVRVSFGGFTRLVTNLEEADNIRWRFNGEDLVWANGLPILTITKAYVEEAGIYECFLDGDYGLKMHAFFRVVVRECPGGFCGRPGCHDFCPVCYNGGVCSAATCTCVCPVGFTGPECLDVCPEKDNAFGFTCSQTCSDAVDGNCKGKRFCYPDPLGCVCASGWTGQNCDKMCDNGWYGPNCELQCHCDNADCEYFDGCRSGSVCTDGFVGETCKEPGPDAVCTIGDYGESCELQCRCDFRQSCNRTTGECIPYPANITECDRGYYGELCTLQCPCAASKPCDRETAECLEVTTVEATTIVTTEEPTTIVTTEEPTTIVVTTEVPTTTVTTEEPATFGSECSAGWPVINRVAVDGIGFTMLASDKMFNCYGEVTSWIYQGKHSRPFRAIVFRPIVNSDTQFVVVGVNDIPAGASDTSVIYIVPRSDRITVEPGDVIGWSSGEAVLAFDYNVGNASVRWLGGNLHAGLHVDQVINFDGVGLREYSIEARVGEIITTEVATTIAVTSVDVITTDVITMEPETEPITQLQTDIETMALETTELITTLVTTPLVTTEPTTAIPTTEPVYPHEFECSFNVNDTIEYPTPALVEAATTPDGRGNVTQAYQAPESNQTYTTIEPTTVIATTPDYTTPFYEMMDELDAGCIIDGDRQPYFDNLDNFVTPFGISSKALKFPEQRENGSVALSMPFPMPCGVSPSRCDSGMTVSFWAKLTEEELQKPGDKYFVSTGAPDQTGFAVYHNSGTILVVVNNGTSQWKVELAGGFIVGNLWTQIAFTWDKIGSSGLEVFIDGTKKNQEVDPTAYSVPRSHGYITIGARLGSDVNAIINSTETLFDELYIADHYLPESENRSLILGRGVDQDDCRINECVNSYCLDAGIAAYICDCFPGFNGTYCENDINECVSNPCGENGECRDVVDGFVCECEFGYEGVFCEIDTVPDFVFDDSSTADISPEDLLNNTNILIEPLYTLAQKYDDFSDTSSYPDGELYLMTSTGRAGLGNLYPSFQFPTSWVNALFTGNLSQANGECLGQPNKCRDGFSISLWVKLETATISNTPGTIIHAGVEPGRGPFSLLQFTADGQFQLTVNYSTVEFRTKTKEYVYTPDKWFNLGITWRRDRGGAIYINGRLQKLQKTLVDTSSNGRGWLTVDAPGEKKDFITLGSMYAIIPTLKPCDISDVVVWPRYIYEFESHLFLGITVEEYSYLYHATYYWTTDAYIRRLTAEISTYTTAMSNTTEYVMASIGELDIVEGSDFKGSALMIDGAKDQWITSSELHWSCSSNPYMCPDGVTYLFLGKLTPVYDEEYHFVFSTGEQSTRGVSLYQRGIKLGAALTDGDKRWIVEIDHEPDPERWIKVGISWAKSYGMLFYIDGYPVAADFSGYRKIRESDLDYRLAVGRRNDFLGMYSKLAFQQFSFWQEFVGRWRSLEFFGYVDSNYYNKPAFFWDAKRLISADIDTLEANALLRANITIPATLFVGPSGGANLTGMDNIVDLTEDDAHLYLGRMEYTCLYTPSLCPEGISLSMWINIDYNSRSQSTVVYSSGDGTGSNGIGIYFQNDKLVFVVVSDDESMSVQASITDEVLPPNEWNNIGFTFSNVEGMCIYVNGIAASLSNDTYALPVTDGVKIASTDSSDYLSASLKIHNLAHWNYYVFARKVKQLMGMSDFQLDCYYNKEYCWVFDSGLSIVHQFEMSANGSQFVGDWNKEGRAVKTNHRELGWITLGDSFGDTCPSDPSTCSGGVAMSLWLKINTEANGRWFNTNTGGFGYLLSIGAETDGERGIVIKQSKNGLFVEVADGRKLWSVNVPVSGLTYDVWFQLAMTWVETDGLDVVIGENIVGSDRSGVEDIRPNNHNTTICLGKSNGYDLGYVSAEYDDVIMYVPFVVENLPDVEILTKLGEVAPYSTADEYYDLPLHLTTPIPGTTFYSPAIAVTDRDGVAEGAIDTAKTSDEDSFGYLKLGKYRSKCISDLTKCTQLGVTFSVFVKFGSIDHFQDSSTNPDGIGYIMSSGGQDVSRRGFAIYYDGVNITVVAQSLNVRWKATWPLTYIRTWFNVAFSWSQSEGLTLYLNGVAKTTTSQGYTTSFAPDLANLLVLGRRNDRSKGYLGAAFDDPAIWYHKFDEEADGLMGEDPEEIEVTSNHEELDKLAPFTGKPGCKVTHDADCSRDIVELNTIIEEEGVDEVLLASAEITLARLAEPSNTLTSDDLGSSVDVFDILVAQPLPTNINESFGLSEVNDFLKICSDLLDVNRVGEWQLLQETKPGSPLLVQDLEDYGFRMTKKLRDNNEDLEFVLTAPNIALHSQSLLLSSYDENGFTFPNYSDPRWYDTIDNWNLTVDSIVIPKNIFEFTVLGETITTMMFMMYDSLPYNMPPRASTEYFNKIEGRPVRVNSRILSFTMEPKLRQPLHNPVEITLQHLSYINDSIETRKCAYWDYDALNESNSKWATDGCEIGYQDEEMTTCFCYHLTAFAVVMDPLPEEESSIHDFLLPLIIQVGTIASMIVLLIIIIFLLFSKRLRTRRHTLHVNLFFAGFMMALCLLITTFVNNEDEAGCKTTGILLHFFVLAVQFWIVVESVHLLLDVTQGLLQKSDKPGEPFCSEHMKYYNIIGWGIPFMIVSIAIATGVDAYELQDGDFCWLSLNRGLTGTFIVPWLIADIFCAVALFTVWRRTDEHVRRADTTTGFYAGWKATSILLVIYNITWLFGNLAIYDYGIILRYIFYFMASFYGFAMYYCHSSWNRELKAVICFENPDFELTVIRKIYLKPEPVKKQTLVYHA